MGFGVWWFLSGVLFVLLALGALFALRWLRRHRAPPPARRREAPRLRHPVVLAHGLLGFDAIELWGSRFEYFRGVPARLRQLGSDVFQVSVPPIGSVAARAEALAKAIQALPSARVNVVAHSMGGLDARYAISRLGLS